MSVLVSSDREDVVFKDEPLPSLPSYERRRYSPTERISAERIRSTL